MKDYATHKAVRVTETSRRYITGYLFGAFPFFHFIDALPDACISFNPHEVLQNTSSVEKEEYDLVAYSDLLMKEVPEGQMLPKEPNHVLDSFRQDPEFKFMLGRFNDAFSEKLKAFQAKSES